MTYHPTTALVAQAWLATIPGITADMVGSQLPSDNSTWEASGFVRTTPVAGTIGPDALLRDPLVQLDFYACKRGSQRPPLAKANQLAEIVIVDGCFRRASGLQRRLTVKDGYSDVHLREAWPTTEPLRMEPDESSYSRYRVDVQLVWSEIT